MWPSSQAPVASANRNGTKRLPRPRNLDGSARRGAARILPLELEPRRTHPRDQSTVRVGIQLDGEEVPFRVRERPEPVLDHLTLRSRHIGCAGHPS